MEQVKESLSVLLISAEDTVGLILWCIFIGVCIALFSLYRQKRGLGRVLTLLLEKEAFSPETALELNPKLVPASYRKGRERMIGVKEEEGKLFFYLPEKNVEKAQSFLKSAKTPLWLALLELLGLYVVLFIISKVLPLILDGFSNL